MDKVADFGCGTCRGGGYFFPVASGCIAARRGLLLSTCCSSRNILHSSYEIDRARDKILVRTSHHWRHSGVVSVVDRTFVIQYVDALKTHQGFVEYHWSGPETVIGQELECLEQWITLLVQTLLG